MTVRNETNHPNTLTERLEQVTEYLGSTNFGTRFFSLFDRVRTQTSRYLEACNKGMGPHNVVSQQGLKNTSLLFPRTVMNLIAEYLDPSEQSSSQQILENLTRTQSAFFVPDYPADLMQSISGYLEHSDRLNLQKLSKRHRDALQIFKDESYLDLGKEIRKYPLNLQERYFQKLLTMYPNTKYIDHYPALLLQNGSLKEVTEKLLDIETLSVEGLELIPDNELKLLENLKSLKSLKTTGSITDRNTAARKLTCLSGLKSLRTLLTDWHICDIGLMHIAKLENLEKLGSSKCEITDEGLERFCPQLKKLRHLDLAGCTNITEEGLRHLSIHQQNLQRLYLEGVPINDTGLMHIANLKNLEKVMLLNCNNITDEGLDYFSSQLQKLQYLDLAGCQNITDEGLRHLSSHLPNLRSLLLTGCENITNEGLRHLSSLLPNLQTLYLSGRITNEGLEHFYSQLKNLRHLGLIKCQNITDAGLRHLSTQLPNLRSLNLAGCQNVTDAGLKHLSTQLPNLRSLNLAGCHHITIFGIATIGTLSNIKELNVSGCLQIPPERLSAFKNHHSHINIRHA